MMEVIGSLLLGLGGFCLFTGAVGLHRMPDFFTRLHPAGVSDGPGLMLILLGIACLVEPGVVTLKLILLGVFTLVTGATACHALAHAALHSGLKPIGRVEKKE